MIPTDCTFNDKCYGRVGFQNEFANYSKKDYDSTLKKAYDIKPFDYSYSDKIYTFAEPKSKKNKWF